MESYWLAFAIVAGMASNIANFITRKIIKDEKDVLTFSLFLEIFKVPIFTILAFFDFYINLSPKTVLLLVAIVASEPIAIYLYMKMHELNHLSISSIITRTRMIWVAILAFLLIGESLKIVNYIGIAVIFLGLSTVVSPRRFFVDKGIKIATLFSFEVAIFVVLLKELTKDISLPLIILFTLIPSSLIFFLKIRNKKQTINSFVKNKFKLKTIFAIVNFIGFYGYIIAIKHGPVSIVTAIYQSMIIFAVLGGIIFLKEHEDIAKKIAGSAITVLGILLLTTF